MSSKHSPAPAHRAVVLVVLGTFAVAGCLMGATQTADAADDPAAAPVIPVDLVSAFDGGYLPTVEVSINGSTPMRMMIDEGTPELVAFPGSIIDPTTPIDETGTPHSIQYDGTAASGQVALGTVTVSTASGSVSTPQQVAFLDADSCTPDCLGYKEDIQGVIGISQSKDATQNIDPTDGIYSVLAQLGQPLSSGYTIDFTGDQPNIQLGAPTAGSHGDTTIQRADQDGLKYPNGQSIYKPPVICWSIGLGPTTAATCNNTVLDTGQSTGKLNGDVFDPVVTPTSPPPSSGSVGRVSDGAVIAFSVSAASAPFARLASTGTVPHQYAQFTTQPKAVQNYFNAGNDFYLSHAIGFDNDSGTVIIHATVGAPASPTDVTASAGDGTITVGWTAPAPNTPAPAAASEPADVSGLADVSGPADATEPSSSTEPTDLTGFVVTVRTADGAIASTTTSSAQSTDARISGLTNGTPYSVAVAAINELTIGPDAAAPGTVTPEAQAWGGPPDTGAPSTGISGSSPAGSTAGSANQGATGTAGLAATGSSVSPTGPVLAAVLVLAGTAALVIRRRFPRRTATNFGCDHAATVER